MELIRKYFPELSAIQLARLERLGELYAEWNRRLNLVSRKDIGYIFERHILHSLALAGFMRFSPGSAILDIGTGGGFPGIPLAIFFNTSSFTLVDSIQKKIRAVNDIIRETGLENACALHQRAENIDTSFDFIVARAVSPFPDFVRNFGKLIRKGSSGELLNGIIYYKGGDLHDELERFRGKVTVFQLSDRYTEAYFETKKIIYLPMG